MEEKKQSKILKKQKIIWILIFISSGIGVLLSLIGTITETYTVYYKYYYLFLTFWTNWTVFIYYGFIFSFLIFKRKNLLQKITNIKLRFAINSYLVFVFFAVLFLFIPIYFFSWINVINFDAFPDYVGSTWYSGKTEPIIVPGLETFILHFVTPILLIIDFSFMTKKEQQKLNSGKFTKKFNYLLLISIYLLFYLFFVEMMAFILPQVYIGDDPGQQINYDYFRIYPYTILSYQYFPVYGLVLFIFYLTFLYFLIYILFRGRIQNWFSKLIHKRGKNE
ncbi:/ / hypothetical protein / 374576:375388 Reverse [Candidatus Hepatoplasma crinochetorum]|uniref:Uncharacterized protein n=1 Tax=Candidatus Hepatoplasma crinochetorum TaxID=295596 RepID=A0A0G7ZMU2_9MOLU|nr:/ / hypothetical protein / 374576:375388 Reverse [Candidatus Hepatoplasma crinochetorum]